MLALFCQSLIDEPVPNVWTWQICHQAVADRRELFWQHLLVTWRLRCGHHQHTAGLRGSTGPGSPDNCPPAAAEHPTPPPSVRSCG
jgi:hypothetical protein